MSLKYEPASEPGEEPGVIAVLPSNLGLRAHSGIARAVHVSLFFFFITLKPGVERYKVYEP